MTRETFKKNISLEKKTGVRSMLVNMKRRSTVYRSKKVKEEKGKKSNREPTRIVKLKSESSVKYPSNRVITSKYTVWNFLPKNLFEQFRRIANFYFLCMAIISMVIEGPVPPATSIIPLLFVILVSAIKQGYEDFLRHMVDKEVNNSPVSVIRKGCVQTIPSKQIKVGDLVKVECDQDIPCDLVLLLSTHPESKCFVTTANLDGETNLKTLHCPRSLKRTCRTEKDLNSLEATIKCENPTPHLYKFHGRIEFDAKTSTLLRRSALLREQSICSGKESETDFELVEMQPRLSKASHGNETTADLSKSPIQMRTKASQAKRTESFPKSAVKTHKKTYSNVERISFNLEKIPVAEPKVQEWSYETKATILCKRNPSLLTNLNRQSFRTATGNVADPLSAENLLLRGSKLKSTDFIYGCAIYTGPETKLALNSKLTSNKFSTVEKSINKYLLFFLGVLAVMVITSTVFKVVKESRNGYEYRAPYITNEENYGITFVTVLEDFFSFVALYNYVIPISLYVTIELQKFLGTLFFEWDLRMYDEGTDETAVCNTSDLNEDLGQIEYLFTDKTGTLTKNEMQFERCSVNGIAYLEHDGVLYPISPETGQPDKESPVDLKNCSREMELFLCALTLCHTVQVSEGGEKYNATSPDEKALIEAMKKLDIVFQDDEDEVVVIRILGQCKFFKKLEVLEFSSDRKRMSVIIEDDEENITLYCKGAETSVIPQVKSGPKELTLKHVADFATQRLRTLVVGYKFFTKTEYERISEMLRVARQTLSSNREAIVADTYKRVESNLTVLGATGIKDDIQEEVSETLKSLKAAGIKIWMLTGDKLETAENISLECGHFEENFIRLILTQQKNPKTCRDLLQQYLMNLEKNTEKDFGLIIDGESLTTSLMYNKDLFRTVCVKCTAVICSRMSPLQKKEVVKLIKDQKSAPITAAIGDGANDVSMIQEAHVGIGIMGKEGRQAVRCSDFAFAKFKFLRRALLVHGHWYYLRVANLVQYFFYKNIAFVLPQFYFLFFSGYSLQSLYNGLYLTGFNTVFTSLPVLIYGLVEQNYAEESLINNPELYLIHKRNKLMSWWNFLTWFALGMWHSLVVFFFPTLYYFINSSVLSGSREVFLESYGTLIFHSSTTVVSLKLLLHSRFWSGIFIGSVIASEISLIAVSVVYSFIFIENLTSSNYYVYLNLLGSPTFWFLIILICAASLVPDFAIYAYLDRNRKKDRSSQR